MTLTYGDLRSNAEKLADEAIKERILRGIEVLNAYDPKWADYIDPSLLALYSPRACVLGQVFKHVDPTEEQIEAFRDARGHDPDNDGYSRGIAILDGELLANDGPAQFGFDTDGTDTYSELDVAWLVVLGYEDAVGATLATADLPHGDSSEEE